MEHRQNEINLLSTPVQSNTCIYKVSAIVLVRQSLTITVVLCSQPHFQKHKTCYMPVLYMQDYTCSTHSVLAEVGCLIMQQSVTTLKSEDFLVSPPNFLI